MSATREADAALAVIRAHPEQVGLCARCRHLAAATSRRSIFVRCGASTTHGLPRYPVLPVASCAAFAAEES